MQKKVLKDKRFKQTRVDAYIASQMWVLSFEICMTRCATNAHGKTYNWVAILMLNLLSKVPNAVRIINPCENAHFAKWLKFNFLREESWWW